MQEDTTDELPSVDELLQRVADSYDSLPRQLKSVATYLEQHRSSVMVDRTADIAASCGVHPSAVVRFAQRFGFSGFSDLQEVFKQAYTGQNVSGQTYKQRIRKLIDTKPGRLSGGSVARCMQRIQAVARSVDCRSSRAADDSRSAVRDPRVT